MSKKTEYDYDAALRYKITGSGMTPPSNRWSDILCPFCGRTSRAYHWSISGGGKKCVGCGAMFNSMGTAAPVKKAP